MRIRWTHGAPAMHAQSDDVLDAAQVKSAQAIDSGALVSSPEVTVSTDPETSAVVVHTANPSVVYAAFAVPAVYVETGIRSFLVSEAGTSHQADLAERTLETALEIESFDPG